MWTRDEFGKLLGGAFVTAGVFALVSRALDDSPNNTIGNGSVPQPSPMPFPQEPQPESAEMQVQRWLSWLGYYHGPVDGHWTIETSQALSEFQRAFNIQRRPNPFLRTDGVLDQASKNALEVELNARHLDSPVIR